jgi:hypothetical protein
MLLGGDFVMPYPTRSEASGIWQLNEISRALLGGDWPVSGPFQIEYLVIAGGGGERSNQPPPE